jgi:hypothetical protein
MTALSLAVVHGAADASKATGIPERTIRLWMDQPEYAELRAKTRDELAEGFKALAHLAMTSLLDQVRAGLVEPRDLTILLGVATDKHLLMSGDATSRTEHRTLGDELDDHERAALKGILEDVARGEDPGSDPGAGLDPVTPPAAT